MGRALWRRLTEPDERDALPAAEPRAFMYCIEVFGRRRSPWRSSPQEALADAIRLDLAAWDESRQEHYLAVPVDMRVRRPEPPR